MFAPTLPPVGTVSTVLGRMEDSCGRGGKCAGPASSSELQVQRLSRAECQPLGRRPRVQGSGNAQRESPQGTVHTPQLGTGPALLVTRDVGSGKLEAPGDLDRRRPAKGAPDPPVGTARHIHPLSEVSAPGDLPTLPGWGGAGGGRGGLPAGGEMSHWFCCAGLTPEPKIEAEINCKE